MIVKTEAICLKNTRFGESSIVSKMFSLKDGLSSYMVQGVHRKSNTIRPSHLTPGNILEMVIYEKPNASMQRIKEVKTLAPLYEIHSDMKKNAVLQFILEIVAKTNEEMHPDEMIYRFLKDTLLRMESGSTNPACMPIYFLRDYLKFTGWYPDPDLWKKGFVFEMQEGVFGSDTDPVNRNKLEPEMSELVYRVLVADSEDELIYQNRKKLLKTFVEYYDIHLLKGKKIQSPEVLSVILS